MGLKDLLFGRDTGKLEYQRQVAIGTAQGESMREDNPEVTYLQTMARVAYLTYDENVIKYLFDHPFLHPLIAPLAPVNRTTILSKDQAELNRIDLEILFTQMKLTMPPDIYEEGIMELFQGFRIFGNNIVNDAIEGKKLIALTQVAKRIQIETDKKEGFWPKRG